MRTLRLITTILILLTAIYAEAVTPRPVFVIPIETEIDNSAFHHFRQGVRQAREHNADMLLVRLNTYGGALDAADSIRTKLLKNDITTLALVDVNAASAVELI